MKQKVITLLLCCIMLLSTTLTAYGEKVDTAPCNGCSTSNSQILTFAQDEMGLKAELLDAGEAAQYISMLSSQFKGINNLKEKTGVFKVVKVTPLNFIYIIAVNKSDPNKVLYSVIDEEKLTIKLLMLVDVTENGDIQISEYDTNGTLKK